MRAGFLAGVLLLAGAYTYYAFAELTWLSASGRLGPGFFPRLVGGTLVVLCAHGLYDELKRGGHEDLSEFWRVTASLALLSALFVGALEALGGLLSMIAYMAASLALLNRGRVLQNALLSVVLPLCLYLVFRVWLNAALPSGPLPL